MGEEREELTAQRRKEIEAIQRAMDEENERVGTAQSRQITSREEEDGHKWSRGTVLSPFLSAQNIFFELKHLVLLLVIVYPDLFPHVSVNVCIFCANVDFVLC